MTSKHNGLLIYQQSMEKKQDALRTCFSSALFKPQVVDITSDADMTNQVQARPPTSFAMIETALSVR